MASPGRGGRWKEGRKGRSLSRPQRPPPAGRPSRPAPTCGARDLPEPPAARLTVVDPHRPRRRHNPRRPLQSAPLLRPAAARASGRRALAERDQSRRTASAHWGSRERAEAAANRQREASAAQLRGAMETGWAGPAASLAQLTAVAPGGAELRPRGAPGERRVEAAGSRGARECEGRWELICEPPSVELNSHF